MHQLHHELLLVRSKFQALKLIADTHKLDEIILNIQNNIKPINNTITIVTPALQRA